MPTLERSNLHVEGRDDVYVINQLLRRHGINCPVKGDSHPKSEFSPDAPEIKSAGDKNAVLAAIEPAVRVSNGRSVGFVLDANTAPQDRWQAVCSRLRNCGLTPPDTIPMEGFVDESDEFRARVGVWLMPHNQLDGALEQFLRSLVPDEDVLYELAEVSTRTARKKGASFPDSKEAKAFLHTWLAWQENPGLRYGTAVNAGYFGKDSRAARAFVTWFKQVFGRQSQASVSA